MIYNSAVAGSGSQDLTSYFKDFIMKNGKHGVLSGASRALVTCDPPSDDWLLAFYLVSPDGEWSLFTSKIIAGQIPPINSDDGSLNVAGMGSTEMTVENYNANRTVEVYVWYSIPCEMNITS